MQINCRHRFCECQGLETIKIGTITAFEKDWYNIKAFLNGGEEWISVFAKVEVLKRQALFIHDGVKSMKVHNLDKDALYVPDVSMKYVLNEIKNYSSISIEFIAINLVI